MSHLFLEGFVNDFVISLCLILVAGEVVTHQVSGTLGFKDGNFSCVVSPSLFLPSTNVTVLFPSSVSIV